MDDLGYKPFLEQIVIELNGVYAPLRPQWVHDPD